MDANKGNTKPVAFDDVNMQFIEEMLAVVTKHLLENNPVKAYTAVMTARNTIAKWME